MANVNGTAGNDFIHVLGDGLIPPGGYIDNPGATNGDDVITSGNGGSDVIHAGDGNDFIHFGGDLDSTDRIFGGAGFDTVVLNDQTTVVFSPSSLSGIEVISIPDPPLPVGVLGFMSLTMRNGNVLSGASMSIQAGSLSADVFFSFYGGAETDGTFSVTGGAGDDWIVGGQHSNLIGSGPGGIDHVEGGAGYDSIFFGDTLTASDSIVAGPGDSISIGGPSYAAGLTFAPATLTSSGSTLLYSALSNYVLVMDDANVVAGTTFYIQSSNGTALQSMNFDGSAERDGSLSLQGMGGNDVLTGGRQTDYFFSLGGQDTLDIAQGGDDQVNGGVGDDAILAGRKFSAGDSINGGTEWDTLFLDGDYSAGVTFGFATLVGVENIVLSAHHDYTLTTHDGTVDAAQTFVVGATALKAPDTLDFDGSAELDGNFFIVAGKGADSLTGGAGNDWLDGGGGKDTLEGGLGDDRFYYSGATDSTSVGYDTVKRANFSADVWDVPATISAIDGSVTAGRLSTNNFDTQLAAAVSHLQANHATMFLPDRGDLAGSTFLVVDLNGAAGYQAGGDLVIQLKNPVHLGAIDAGDFI